MTEKRELSSGVEVLIAPIPGDLYTDVTQKALLDHPDPEPPKKIIEVVDGTEEIDNVDDPEYQKAVREASQKRTVMVADAILDLCVQCEVDEGMVAKYAKYSPDQPPEDPDDLRLWFLKKLALRTSGDWEVVTGTAVAQTMIADEEVRARLDFFRREVAGDEGDGLDARGPDAEGELDVHEPDA